MQDKTPKEFTLGFHGSRGLSDERVKIIILEEIDKHKPSTIVTHAEPEGVCGLVREICKDRGIPLKLCFLNFKYKRGAFERRSKAVLESADHSIFIHNGKSKGTLNEIKLAKKMGLPMTGYKLAPAEFEQSVGFPIEVNWDEFDFEQI